MLAFCGDAYAEQFRCLHIEFSLGTLALHIRSLRQWYGECGISQDELSALAGISTRVLKRYESARELPRALACLLAVALALQVSPEHLLDPRGLARLKEQIERRRRTVSAL